MPNKILLQNVPRELGKLTPEQLAKEREARACREEIFRRICDEAEATGSTFGEAASRLGVPARVIQYFQTDYENARVKESLASRRLRAVWDFLKPAVSAIVLLVATAIISSDYQYPHYELAWLALVVILVAWRKRLGSFAMRLAEVMKSDWRAAVAFSAALLILGLGALAVPLFRYEVKTSTPGLVVRLDRLTGKVEWCTYPRGCSEWVH